MSEEAKEKISDNKPKETKKRAWWKVMFRIFLRTVKYVFIAALTLIVALVILAHFTFFQTFLFSKSTSWLSEKLGFEIKAESIYFDFYNSHLTLKKLSIRDLQDKQMVYAEKLYADIQYKTAFSNNTILIDDILLDHATIVLITDAETKKLNINQFIARINKLTAPKNPDPNAKSPKVFIQKIQLKDTYFGYEDNRKKRSQKENMDYAHFSIDDMYGDVKDLQVIGDTIQAEINGLRGIEHKTKLNVKKLNTFFRMTKGSMEFKKLYANFNNSVLKDELFMGFDSMRDMSNFIDKVTIVANLDSTIIDTDDLAIFAPAVKQYKDIWRIKGTFRGLVKDFDIKDLNLYLGKDNHSHLQGDVAFEGLPDIDETFMTLNLKNSQILGEKLSKYIPRENIRVFLRKIAYMDFDASFKGKIDDFIARGKFSTPIGFIECDANLKLNRNAAYSQYKGDVKTRNFNIGKLLDLPILGVVSMEGNIVGRGFTPQSANLTLDASVGNIYFNRYSYNNISVDGKLSQLRFVGEMLAQDPNFDFNVQGEIDFNENPNNPELPQGRFDLEADIEMIDFQALNFSPVESKIKGKIKADAYGLSLDKLSGEVLLSDAEVIYQGKGLTIENLDILSFRKDEGGRFFELRSEFVDFETDGNFTFAQIIEDFEELYKEYYLAFRNNPEELEAYYTKKNKRKIVRSNIDFKFNFKNINPVLTVFTKDVYIARDTKLKGQFRHGKTSIFNISTVGDIDSIAFKNYQFLDIYADISTSKLADSSEVLASAMITSKKQTINSLTTKNTNISAFWGNGLIDFDFEFEQEDTESYADLGGTVEFQKDTTVIAFRPSNFQLLEDKWRIAEDNTVKLFGNNTVEFQNLNFYNKEAPNSRIKIDGFISSDIMKPLDVEVKDVNILAFTKFFGFDISGLLNLEATVENIYQQPEINSKLDLEELVIDNVLIGDLFGRMDWQTEEKALALNFDLRRRGKDVLDLRGSILPYNKRNNLNLTADLNGTTLKLFEPFTKGLVSNLRGELEGKIDIRGSLKAPVVEGKTAIKHAYLTVDYLQTSYNVEGDVIIKQNEVTSPKLYLFDEYNNPATANFTLFHDNFSNMYIEMASKFYNFHLLNTQKEDNDLFYGTAFATGSFNVSGFLNHLQMDITAKSKKGTKLSLPLEGYEEVSQKDFITFVSLSRDPNKNKIKKIDLGGMKLNFNLEVTRDAEFEIIFDSKAGDIIKGQGHGNIEMEVDTEGDFNIYGNYVIDEGKYNFTFGNVVNKGFNITRGSRIGFNGDMYRSVLDIQAEYTKFISLKPLINIEQVADPENPEYRRSYPVTAVMSLKGVFLSPEIKLDLDLEEAKKAPNPNLQTAVLQLDNRIQNDEQERNRQVFSLIVLNRLSPPNAFTGVGGAAGSSLSELISNQFSNWVSQVDENLELSLDIDANDLNTLQLRVSYSLLDGRLRISRDGGFTNTQNQADFASVIGDWTVEYLLTPGGKYRIKMYNRTNQNAINNVNLNNATSTTAGISFLHTASFNKFGDLFKSKKKKKTTKIGDEYFEEEEDEENTQPEFKAKEDSEKDTLNPASKQNINREDMLPLPHRESNVSQVKSKPKNDYSSNTSNTTPADRKTDYLEGDEDNEPIPERYLDEDTKENIKVSKENLMPLKHRFGELERKKKGVS